MKKELVTKSKSLAGVSDLTLFATIREGFVPSLEPVSYKTRLLMVLKTLGLSRASSQEYALVRPVSDSVERVAAIHSVRLVVLEPENKLMLAATFDGAWDTYIRTLWLKVGTLLDAIFCNTEGYVTSYDHGFEAWAAWARRVQVETRFFYGQPQLSVPDVQVLRRTHQLLLAGGPQADAALAELSAERAEDQAWRAATGSPPPGQSVQGGRAAETVRQGLQALAVLYRLADVYLPGTADGDILRRAARELLLEFVELQALPPSLRPPLPAALAQRFERQLAWFNATLDPRPAPPGAAPDCARDDVQAGILSPIEGITHGALLMLALPDPAAAAQLLDRLLPRITRDCDVVRPGRVVCTVAFTSAGLRALGLGDAELEAFAPEFREGMEARASVLGDLRTHHPRRWTPPLRNWAGPWPGDPTLELSAVHLVLQLRVGSPDVNRHFDNLTDARHPLNAEIHGLLDGLAVNLLSMQPMWRNHDPRRHTTREHFGFADGISQPIVDTGAAEPVGPTYDGRVPLGDLLLGHANGFDPAPPHHELLHNGSFLVVRKLRQDVAALDRSVRAAAKPLGMSAKALLERMMGRRLNGKPLVPSGPGGLNDFDYSSDPKGRACPLQAHVRRANPRTAAPPRSGRETPVPRIMRRGMSYGPPYNRKDEHDPVNAEERGIVFMAYNARIAEQFEVIQRWLSGGNSSGLASSQSDPFFGVPGRLDPHTFRFVRQLAGRAKVQRADLHDPSDPLDDPARPPIVRLEWGAYLFAPSITALKALRRIASQAPAHGRPVWSVLEGEQLIARLQAQDAGSPAAEAAARWKALLEDPTPKREFRSASVWAAIRARHGGVLRTPLGVLVAERALVHEVFADPHQRYSVKGYLERTAQSFGEIYLGLDRDAPGGEYDRQATLGNAAIQAIRLDEAFTLSRRFALRLIDARIALDQALAKAFGKPTWELNLDTKEVSDEVLIRLCEEWFGLPGPGAHLVAGSLRWDWKPGEAPLYPGHFTAPSRYVFQPEPGVCPVQMGQAHGQALRVAVRQFALDHRLAGTVPATPSGAPARVGAALFADPLALADPDWFSRTFVGALVGFLPSVDGNFRASLNEWLLDDSFWALRERLAAAHSGDALHDAQAVLLPALMRSMQLRPAPETAWRTAVVAHQLGKVAIAPGDKVVLAIVSATQQALEEGHADVMPIFGGRRCPGLGAAPTPAPANVWPAGQPTHACPGYEAGMGVLLGLFSALLSVKQTLRPSPAPLSLTLTGPTS